MTTPKCIDGDVLCAITELKIGHKELKENQDEIRELLNKNNEMTSRIIDIFESVKGFFSFCAKAGKAGVWVAKKGTIIAAFVVGIYHAIDAIATHDIIDIFRNKGK